MENTTNEYSEHVELTCGKPVEIKLSLDPHLQDMILMKNERSKLKRKRIEPEINSSLEIDAAVEKISEDDPIIDVVAKLKSKDAEVPGLVVCAKIGHIVTGTVKLSMIENVKKNVISLKHASGLHPEQDLIDALNEINAAPEIINQTFYQTEAIDEKIDGTGVIVGIVDYDCDFAHPNFCRSDTESRIMFLWDQRGGVPPTGKVPYGREFCKADIDSALARAKESNGDPYGELGYDPGGTCSHGTHVLDIAAGNGMETDQAGVAPNADIIFVHLAPEDYEEIPASNSRRLIEAVKYIFDKAGDKSAVVNISLGFRGGPHDGTTLVEEAFDTLLEKAGRAIVIAAGNSRSRRSHASGVIEPHDTRVLGWEIPRVDSSDNQIEIWYDGDRTLEATLLTPDNLPLGPVNPGFRVPLEERNTIVGRIFHRVNDPNNNDNHILILLDKSLSGGWPGGGLYSEWKVALKNNSDEKVTFHSWIERSRSGQSRFVKQDDDPSYTVGSLACGKHTIVVGSYDSTDRDSIKISDSSGEGPTRKRRDGKRGDKPEVIAPGHEISAACAKDWKHTREGTGTSVAAPFVTGTIALIMQAAKRKLDIKEIRDAVIKTARIIHNSSVDCTKDRRYGGGRVDALAAVLSIVGKPPSAGILEPGSEFRPESYRDQSLPH